VFLYETLILGCSVLDRPAVTPYSHYLGWAGEGYKLCAYPLACLLIDCLFVEKEGKRGKRTMTHIRPFPGSCRWACVSTPEPVRSMYQNVRALRMPKFCPPLGEMFTCPVLERGAVPLRWCQYGSSEVELCGGVLWGGGGRTPIAFAAPGSTAPDCLVWFRRRRPSSSSYLTLKLVA
jgi:hypothetical protein